MKFLLYGFILLLFSSSVLALTKEDITFPVEELDNCQNKEECKTYCDDPLNQDACDTFREKYGLNPIDFPVSELGNCSSREECETYCSNSENLEPCINFAESHTLMSREKLEKAKKILPFLKQGTTPGNCKNELECKSYCESDDHFEECISFAEEAGFISHQEAERAKQVGRRGGPGECKGEEECRLYCSEDTHFDECIIFLEENNLISGDHLENLKKVGSFKGPGGCTSEEECNAFCEANTDACIDFALQHGIISEENAEMARRTGGEGPGDCRGREECEAYCGQKEHQDECTEFAYQNGLMSEEDYKRATMTGPGGCRGDECKDYCEQNPLECAEYFGNPMPPRESDYLREVGPLTEDHASSESSTSVPSEESRSSLDKKTPYQDDAIRESPPSLESESAEEGSSESISEESVKNGE